MSKLWDPWPEIPDSLGYVEIDWDFMAGEARRLMAGGRLSLSDAAAVLKVRPGDLDRALWRNIGRGA